MHQDVDDSDIETEASQSLETQTEDRNEDDVLADVTVESASNDNALRYVDPEAAAYYPDIKTAREAAQIPEHIAVKNLVGIPILIASKRDQKATVPESGEIRPGFFVTGLDLNTKKPFTTWIGQVALLRDLAALSPPFRVTITKHGKAYRFE